VNSETTAIGLSSKGAECPFGGILSPLLYLLYTTATPAKKPMSISHIFEDWIKSFHCKQRENVLLGLAAVCWAIWLGRNNVVFQRSRPDSCLHVILRSASWIRSWSILSKEEDKKSLLIGSRRLEMTTLKVFNNYGWNALERIAY
jgi:hypothetical protein